MLKKKRFKFLLHPSLLLYEYVCEKKDKVIFLTARDKTKQISFCQHTYPNTEIIIWTPNTNSENINSKYFHFVKNKYWESN